MSVKSKSLAKSLHTVSALVAVARLVTDADPSLSPVAAVQAAADVLGYAVAEDPYGLKTRAAEILSK